MNIKSSYSVILLAGGLLLSTAEAATPAYKCITPDGSIEYIDLPRAGYNCTLVHAAPTPSPPKAEAEAEAEPESAPEQAKSSTASSDATEASNDPRQANCELARKNLELLQGDQAVVTTDKEGNKVLLNNEQRQAQQQTAQKDINYWCN